MEETSPNKGSSGRGKTRDIHSTYRYLAGYSPYPFKMDLSRVKFNVTPPTVLVSLVLLFRLV